MGGDKYSRVATKELAEIATSNLTRANYKIGILSVMTICSLME